MLNMILLNSSSFRFCFNPW